MINDPDLSVASPKQMQLAMRDMRDRVRAWWKREGLGHTSSISLCENGSLDVEFSCSLQSEIDERAYDDDQALPEAERRLRAQHHFEARGLVLHAAPGSDVAVRDCDASCAALRQLIKDTFPSSVVRAIETRGARDGSFVLQSVQVMIRDLEDVYALATPDPAA